MHPTRTPVVSLELLLDATAESHLRAQWTALAEAGLSSMGAHTAPSNRPHVTLVVRPQIRALSRAELDAVVTLPLALEIGDPVLFGSGDRRVLARSVTPSAALLELHAALHALVGNDGTDAAHTRPGEWTPHLTLARRLRADDLPRALRILDETAHPEGSGHAEATVLRRWDAASATVTDLVD